MPSFTLSENSDTEYEVIPDSTVLEAVVTDIEERDHRFFHVDKDDPTSPMQKEINFKFKITEEGEFQGRTVFGSTPPWFNTSPKCKFRTWTQEILGSDDLPVDFVLNTDALIGEPVKVIMGTYPKKDGGTGNSVVDLARIEGVAWAEEAF